VLHEQTELFIELRDSLDGYSQTIAKLQDPKLSLSLSTPGKKPLALSAVNSDDSEAVALTISIEKLEGAA
jgi:hypothetical protein